MHEKAMRSAVERDSAIDEAVMGLLLGEYDGLWAVEEVEREIGDSVQARDSLDRLVGGGLVHKVDERFVSASRAARLAREVPL